MIYLDVTSACQSALNTGVKRIQRGMHASLRHRTDYRPVCWQLAGRYYRNPHPAELETLEGAKGNPPRGLGLFDSFAPGALSDWRHRARDASSLLDWPAQLTRNDTILVPDLIWDNRGAFLGGLRGSPARRIGIFHDAIALRRPRQSYIDRYFCRRGIRALASFDAVLCISQEAENDLLHFWRKDGLVPVPTRVAPWPVPFTGSRPLSVPNFSTKRLLYVARLEPHKNHLRLLTACETLWRERFSFDLHMIGCMAYPDTAWRILRRVKKLQKSRRLVQWEAHVSEAELHAAYRACSFMVFPSLLEGFGLPILESLWHGRPVVCGANGALGEVAAGGGCETVDTTNEITLAAGLRRLLTNRVRYDTLYAETQARSFRTWTDYWSDLEEFLRPR